MRSFSHLLVVSRVSAGAIALALVAGAAPAVAASSAASSSSSKAPHLHHRGVLAAQWQGSELSHGRIHNDQFDFDDWGLTVDTAIMLAADGRQHRHLNRVTTAIRNNYYHHYATFAGNRIAGAMAKSLLVAKVLDQPVRHFGGRNVRRELLDLVVGGNGFEAGRLRDSGSTDYSNTFGQAYGVLGLARTGGVPQSVVRYLVKHQCGPGYFGLDETPHQTCAEAGSPADTDATALAVQALVAARRSGADVSTRRVKRATHWLLRTQHRNGSFGGGATTAGANTNSTGVAAQALALTHHPRARARAAAYVASLQLTHFNTAGTPARRDLGAIAYDVAAFRDARRTGIQTSERDQWRRATAEAFYALVPKSFVTISAP